MWICQMVIGIAPEHNVFSHCAQLFGALYELLDQHFLRADK